MATASGTFDTRAVESGFWHGVARAFEHELEIGTILSQSERDRFVGELKDIMRQKCQFKGGDYWNPRAVQHAAECLTIFFLARMTYENKGEKPLDRAATEDFLERYRGNPGGWANSWAHA